MKKSLILTSVLALAACAGGSGGGSAGGALSPEESNRNVVGGMRTVVEITSSKPTPRTASVRSATLPNGGIVYDLSDVNFNMADEGFGGIVGFDVDKNKKIIGFYVLGDKLKTVDDKLAYDENDIEDVYVEDGQIYSRNSQVIITKNDDGTFTYEGDDKKGVFIVDNNEAVQLYEGDNSSIRERGGVKYAAMAFERQGDTSDFKGKIKTDGGEAMATLSYHSKEAELIRIGKELGLEYSDFGYFQLASNEDVDRPVSFITGYDEAKKIEEANIKASVNFTGHAVGSVTAIKGGPNSGKVLALDAPAELTFNAGTSTLTANFDNWYDIQYTKEGGETGKVAFSNFKTDADTQYKFVSETSNPIAVSGEDIRYFGDNNIPSEAVGLIQVRDCGGNACNDDYGTQEQPKPEVRMNLGFGAK